MTWSKQLSLSHNGDGSVTSYFTNVVTPYAEWMNDNGIEASTSPDLGWLRLKYTSTRFGATYQHGLVYDFDGSTMKVYDWRDADMNNGTTNTQGRLKYNDTFYTVYDYARDFEVWKSDQGRYWVLLAKNINSSQIYTYGMFLEPDDLTQGPEYADGYGWREPLAISDGMNFLGVHSSTTARYDCQGYPVSALDQKSPTILIRNFYSIFTSVYGLPNQFHPAVADTDYGMAYMGTPNDIHCSTSVNNLAIVTQIENDNDYYISLGSGAGMFLNCGPTKPQLFDL